MSNTSPFINAYDAPKNETITRTGMVVLCSRNNNRRLVLQPSEGKLMICDFGAPVLVRKNQRLTIRGCVRSEGADTVVLHRCLILTRHIKQRKTKSNGAPRTLDLPDRLK